MKNLNRNNQLVAVLAVLMAWMAAPTVSFASSGPTVQEYLDHVGDAATLVPPGQLEIDGIRMRCGRRPTVLDPTLDDYGAAYPTFLILNPERMAALPTPVKLWIYGHECAHQFRGPDEETADCFAVQRGRRYGWLNSDGIEKICNFIRPSLGSPMHFTGPKRCEIMRRCFVDKRIW